MKVANIDDKDKIVDFLKRDISNCLYIYADITTIGMDDPNLSFWIDEDESGVRCVVMKYYNSLQLYGSFSNDNYLWIKDSVIEKGIDRLSGAEADIKNIHELLKDDFDVHYGSIFSFESSTEVDHESVVEAGTDDVDGIVDLIMTDKELSGGYKRAELKKQIADRISSNAGRSFIIRENGMITGHICFLIETDLFCISGFAIVHPEHRNVQSALRLQRKVYDVAKDEGKEHYFFIDQPRRAKMFEKTGNPVVARYGKLIKQ